MIYCGHRMNLPKHNIRIEIIGLRLCSRICYTNTSVSFSQNISLSLRTGIANRTPAGTLVPSEGFWGAHEYFKIFTRSFKCLIS
jgi:hypothetical protein